ncbi:hypothetical protein Fmac_009424 [Flemingia macrophylla]|uniref:DNA-(apurinic or apyrimidinic site) lyase n=1 Tax=Flemingia macrophylla TaxID=520843 RepID=A0ABD1N0A1_9FABA
MEETQKQSCSEKVEQHMGILTIDLPFGFQLEEAVCSNGFFMMAPNRWDPLSKTLTRPISSSLVSISQRSQSLQVRDQVCRMLRLGRAEEKAVMEFRSMTRDLPARNFAGRMFRSPTLFEDMVKCILLCNCQWSRTLGMAQALCELQLELRNGLPHAVTVSGNAETKTEGFIPKTPAPKETQRKKGSKKGNLLKKRLELEVDGNPHMDCVLASNSNTTLLPTDDGNLEELCSDDSHHHQFPNDKEYFDRTGDFPSPSELANLDESFLAKRCGLGYRAAYLIELARGIIEGKIQLGQLEELSKDASLSSYKQLDDQLKQIKGFGPFTRANVLVCLGYYHVVPTDSETLRHLKQVHSRNTTLKKIERDLEEIYGKYEPYQFLAFWSEIWDFYETRFGKMNEMHFSDYKLITACNMRSTSKATKKRKRP